MLKDNGEMPPEFEEYLFPRGILYNSQTINQEPVSLLSSSYTFFCLPHVLSQEATEGYPPFKRGNKPIKRKAWDSGKKRSNTRRGNPQEDVQAGSQDSSCAPGLGATNSVGA